MVGTASSTGSEEVQGVQLRGCRGFHRQTVAWALQNEERSFERKAVEAEAKMGTRKKHGLSKGLWQANHLSGFERTEA